MIIHSLRYISQKIGEKVSAFLSAIQRTRYLLTCVAYFLFSRSFFYFTSKTDSQETPGFEREFAYEDTSSWSSPAPIRWEHSTCVNWPFDRINQRLQDGRLLRTPRHILTRAHHPDVSLGRFTSARSLLGFSMALIAFLGPSSRSS